MHYLLIVLSLLFGLATSSCTNSYPPGNVSVGIGINVPVYPQLVLVPGYPVYYDPRVNLNYFFYDGLYWVFISDNWYASSWYNGPWDLVGRNYVPLYVLRVPVRYYRQPPAYFRGWNADAPPRWDEHWGRDWEERRVRSDQWGRSPAPDPAPLPGYQQQYSGDRYPREVEQQRSIRTENYRYQPREAVTQERFKQKGRGRERMDVERVRDRR
ncbi:MAG: hypothetical protein WA123_06835 [Methylotenera sp.]